MSRSRRVSTTISQDGRIDQLIERHGSFGALLYTWMIPHAEEDATITGDARELRNLVVPCLKQTHSIAEVEEIIDTMLTLGLLERRSPTQLSFPVASFYRYQNYIGAANRPPGAPTPSERGPRTRKAAAAEAASDNGVVVPATSRPNPVTLLRPTTRIARAGAPPADCKFTGPGAGDHPNLLPASAITALQEASPTLLEASINRSWGKQCRRIRAEAGGCAWALCAEALANTHEKLVVWEKSGKLDAPARGLDYLMEREADDVIRRVRDDRTQTPASL